MAMKRPYNATLVFILLAQSVLTAGQTAKQRFDPDGSFWIHGTAPADFSDFSGINLNAKKLRRLPSPGVQLNDGKNLRYKTLSVTRERFVFTTVAIGGISYSFSGAFLKGGVFAESNLDDETPVLEGVLVKNKQGKKVAEAKLKFTYFGGT